MYVYLLKNKVSEKSRRREMERRTIVREIKNNDYKLVGLSVHIHTA